MRVGETRVAYLRHGDSPEELTDIALEKAGVCDWLV